MGELLRTLKERGTSIAEVPLTPVGARRARSRSSTRAPSAAPSARTSSPRCSTRAGRPTRSSQAEGLAQIGDESALLAIVRDVIGRNADAVTQYRAGKNQTFGFLVGQVMKGSKGKANPKIANDLLKRELDNSDVGFGLRASGFGPCCCAGPGPGATSAPEPGAPEPEACYTGHSPDNLPLTPGAQAA